MGLTRCLPSIIGTITLVSTPPSCTSSTEHCFPLFPNLFVWTWPRRFGLQGHMDTFLQTARRHDNSFESWRAGPFLALEDSDTCGACKRRSTRSLEKHVFISLRSCNMPRNVFMYESVDIIACLNSPWQLHTVDYASSRLHNQSRVRLGKQRGGRSMLLEIVRAGIISSLALSVSTLFINSGSLQIGRNGEQPHSSGRPV